MFASDGNVLGFESERRLFSDFVTDNSNFYFKLEFCVKINDDFSFSGSQVPLEAI